MAQGKAMVMDGIALGAKKAKVVLNVAAPVVEGALALVVGAEKAQQVKEKTKEKLDVVLNVASPVVADGIALGAKKMEQAKEQTKEKKKLGRPINKDDL